MKYFEMMFSDDIEADDASWMCGKGLQIPSVEEANEFYKSDCKLYNYPICGVYEIGVDYARDCYDFSYVEKWPVFSK